MVKIKVLEFLSRIDYYHMKYHGYLPNLLINASRILVRIVCTSRYFDKTTHLFWIKSSIKIYKSGSFVGRD